MQVIGEPIRLVEPVNVPDIFVSGLGEVEDLGGGCFRFVFYSRGGREENVVVAKLVAPREAVPAAILLAAKAIGYSLAAGAYFPRTGLH